MFEVRTERAFSEERNACGSSTLRMYVFAHHYEIKIHFSTKDYVLTVEFVRNQIYLPWKLYPAFLFLRTLDVSAKRDLSCFAIDVKYWGKRLKDVKKRRKINHWSSPGTIPNVNRPTLWVAPRLRRPMKEKETRLLFKKRCYSVRKYNNS